MTREEARKAAEVMLAYADGKEVDLLVEGNGWLPCESEAPCFDWLNNKYRIKSEPTYRPFQSAEECWQEMQKHQPFGWVKDKEKHRSVIEEVCCSGVIVFMDSFDYEKAIKDFTFADGTPFGVKEEEV